MRGRQPEWLHIRAPVHCILVLMDGSKCLSGLWCPVRIAKRLLCLEPDKQHPNFDGCVVSQHTAYNWLTKMQV